MKSDINKYGEMRRVNTKNASTQQNYVFELKMWA